MTRNFGLEKTGGIAPGVQRRSRPHDDIHNASSNIISFRPRQSILIDDELPPSQLSQACFDILALFCWGLLTVATAAAIVGSIFCLLFFTTS